MDFLIFVPFCDLKAALRPPAQGRANFLMRKRWLFLSLICLAHYAQAGTLWIDTDVSIGSPIREVDDAFALVLAFHSPEIRIAGLSTTYGNAPLGQTTRAARDLVERFGQSASLTVDAVFPGAGSASDLGRWSVASDALAAQLQKQKATYIALGPLTNLATFLRLHPKLGSCLPRRPILLHSRRECIQGSSGGRDCAASQHSAHAAPNCDRLTASDRWDGSAPAREKWRRGKLSFWPKQNLALVLDPFRQDKRWADF